MSLQRKRKILVRYGAVALVGVAVIAVALPRAGAHDPAYVAAKSGDLAMLLSPEPLAGRQFAVFYNVPHS